MIEGIHTAIITPFLNGKIDYQALEKMIDFQHQSGIDGVVLHGTTGEAPSMLEEEFIESSQYILEKWKEKLHVTIGISENSTDAVLKKQALFKIQPHAFLISPPSYSKPTQEGIFQHFAKIAENLSTPIILYNVPGRTVADVLPTTLQHLVKTYKNIVAIKDATGNFSRFANEQYLVKSFANFSLLTGDDATFPHFLLCGGNGVVSVISNIAPKQIKEIYDLILQQRRTEAMELYFKFYTLIDLLFTETNPIPVKYAMHKMGFCHLEYRLPMCKPSENVRTAIHLELKKLNLI